MPGNLLLIPLGDFDLLSGIETSLSIQKGRIQVTTMKFADTHSIFNPDTKEKAVAVLNGMDMPAPDMFKLLLHVVQHRIPFEIVDDEHVHVST